MTKKLEFVKCNCCEKIVPNNKGGHSYVKEDGTIIRCNVCKWKKNHKDRLNQFGYSQEEIDRFLYFFLYKESEYLNDIAKILNRNIDEMIELFKNLKICNRKCRIKINCEYCGSEYETNITSYLSSENHYCSMDCYWKDKSSKMPKGKDSPYYNRKDVFCDNCGKPFSIIPSRYTKTNVYGESHNFCSNECYYEFRSKYYVGEKSVNANRIFSDETIEKMRIASANSANKRMILNTSIQNIVDETLNSLNISYEREYPIAFYSIDNYLVDYNLAIEVMGDYWHCNPKIYNENGRHINSIQAKDIVRDKKKRTYLKKYKNINILYLWEMDINNFRDKCIALIKLYIENKGNLMNYNSFNWDYIDDSLVLKSDNIVYPYFEIDKIFYQKIIKSA